MTSKPPNVADIAGVLIRIDRNGDSALFLTVHANGDVTRGESDGVEVSNSITLIGKTERSVFEAVRQLITPAVFQWIGRRAEERLPVGDTIEVTIGFQSVDQAESWLQLKYGSATGGLPSELHTFLWGCVAATDPWFEEFKARVISEQRGRRNDA